MSRHNHETQTAKIEGVGPRLRFAVQEPTRQRREAIPHHRASLTNRLERRRLGALLRRAEKVRKARERAKACRAVLAGFWGR